MKNDNEVVEEMLDTALDSAELKLKEDADDTPDTETTEEPAEVEETPEAPAETPEVSDEAVDVAPTTPDPKNQKVTTKSAASDEAAKPSSSAKLVSDPPFWSSEEKKLLAPASRELQEIVARKAEQAQEWVNRMTSESQQGREIARKTSEVFAPHQQQLKEQGIYDMPGAIGLMGNMLGWNKLFKEDPRTAISELMRQANLTPQHFLGDGTQQEDQTGYSNDPRVEQALADAQEAKELAEEYRRQVEQTKTQSIETEINQFRNGTDSQGNNREQFSRLYAPQISTVYSEIIARNPGLPLTHALDQAYETVLSQARAAHGVKIPAQTQPGVRAPAQAKKAQAAASSIHGAPSSGVGSGRKKAVNIDEAIDASLDAHGFSA